MKKKCPCHSGKEYKKCCFPFHRGEAAPNALTLMRSRYSAYALGLVDYLIETAIGEEHRKRNDIEQFAKQTNFVDLKILDFTEEKDQAYVTFIAYLFQNGQDVSFTEQSRFKHHNDKWYYVDGEVKTIAQP